ncbi:DUF2231 domain-containing protein [Gordonia sp. SL306]|uniref:DUF2231 domain-containing protein n=1 Tax=Gordonia sp. SL306 TaxID=2995145 RepID=UPI00226FAE41|nr:DUF2231 domain-containing protein [Gordonia sp. SL306]WAC53948.1 hypothetical protein OVA31_14715 [Gordonia sp. SL306]
MNTVNGLPAHPLLVHAVVVLVPLASLMAVLAVLWPAARRRLEFLVPLAALAALIAVPLATSAGEALEARVPHTEAVEHHTQLGEQMIYWAGPLFALTFLWWAAHDERVRAFVSDRFPVFGRAGRAVDWLLGAATLVVAIGSVITIYRIGDSGSRAVWM